MTPYTPRQKFESRPYDYHVGYSLAYTCPRRDEATKITYSSPASPHCLIILSTFCQGSLCFTNLSALSLYTSFFSFHFFPFLFFHFLFFSFLFFPFLIFPSLQNRETATSTKTKRRRSLCQISTYVVDMQPMIALLEKVIFRWEGAVVYLGPSVEGPLGLFHCRY